MRGCARPTEGLWRIAHPRMAQQYRLNVGVIVEDPMVEIRLQSQGPADGRRRTRARPAGGIFHRAADARRHVRLLRPGAALRRHARGRAPMSPRTQRHRSANSRPTMAASFRFRRFSPQRVREMVSQPESWHVLPDPVQRMAAHPGMALASFPQPGQLLVETFPRGIREYLVCYPFEGRLAHQTLGMLLTRRLERLRMRPLGFVANEYALAVWALRDMGGARHGRAVRRGHAGRRSRCLAGRVQSLQAHLPQLRDHLRADRAALSGPARKPGGR